MKRIGVMRILPGLGDFLCLVPALRSLRAAEPDASIRLIGLPQQRTLTERFSQYLDGLVEVPHFPHLTEDPGQPQDVIRSLREVQQEQLDLLLQMHGSGIVSNPAAALMGAKAMAGFYLPGQWAPDAESFMPYPADKPEIHRHLALLEHLGYEPKGANLEFPLTDVDRERAADLLRENGVGDDGYVVLHPGASTPERRWPPDRFAAVGNVLAAKGHRVVITGSEEEREVVTAVADDMRHDSVDLAGETDLGTLGALLCSATLLVANDTGVSHLASACATPSVIIFAGDAGVGSEPYRWAPLNQDRHIAITPRPGKNGAAAGDQEELHCPVDIMDRCLRDGCTLPMRHGEGHGGRVSVNDVQRAVERLLGRRPIRRQPQ